MTLVAAHIKWIMLVSGALTCTMVYAAIAPQAALQSAFGETLEGPLAEIIVRNWGVLITLVGGMLIYGVQSAGTPADLDPRRREQTGLHRPGALASGRYLGHQVGLAIAIDLLWVVLFAWYLLARRPSPAVVSN